MGDEATSEGRINSMKFIDDRSINGVRCRKGFMIDSNAMDVLMTNPQSGLKTGLAKTVRRAIKALDASGVAYCVIGAAALAVRGLPAHDA
jgi:hypothetical protein